MSLEKEKPRGSSSVIDLRIQNGQPRFLLSQSVKRKNSTNVSVFGSISIKMKIFFLPFYIQPRTLRMSSKRILGESSVVHLR